jgi:hypothetical protein
LQDLHVLKWYLSELGVKVKKGNAVAAAQEELLKA